MSEVSMYMAQKKKLDGLCKGHDFVYRLRKETYPISLTIRPVQGVGEQLTLLEQQGSDKRISPNASMTWYFKDGELSSVVSGGTFSISKTLRGKFENIFLKIISFWQQYYFKATLQSGAVNIINMPVIDEDDAEDSMEETGEEQDASDISEETSVSAETAEDTGTVNEDLITAATQLVRHENKASTALLQRRLNIGYAAASRLMQELEDRGIVGPYNGSSPREVLPSDVPEEG